MIRKHLLPCLFLLIGVSMGICGCRAGATDTTGTPRVAADVAPTRTPRRADGGAIDPALAQAVRTLTSPDFVERAEASEQLVSRGVSALPALGAAGSQTITVFGEAQVSTTEPVIEAILQAVPPRRIEAELASPHPVIRRGAAEELGRRGRWHPIPQLLARLDDSEPGVRAAAAAALRRLTNNFFGFSARASARPRLEAAGRWRSWWTQEGRRRQQRREAEQTAFLR